MKDLTKSVLTAEMTELRDETVKLGNVSEIKMTMPREDGEIAERWEKLLDTVYDLVSDFAKEIGITLPE